MPPSLENPDNIFEVQNLVFSDLLERENSPEMAFILKNSPLFRHFADHLDPSLWDAWRTAANDQAALRAIENSYENFRGEVERSLEQMDPELASSLSEAVRANDIELVSKILETHLEMMDRVHDTEFRKAA